MRYIDISLEWFYRIGASLIIICVLTAGAVWGWNKIVYTHADGRTLVIQNELHYPIYPDGAYQNGKLDTRQFKHTTVHSSTIRDDTTQ